MRDKDMFKKINFQVNKKYKLYINYTFKPYVWQNII